ncbi:MAG TPA: L,D-transpeptidase [Patescibacteria group bacterium]|nr:L,D-transpeptidase [Patescibacteria group bacterium]
MKKKPARIKHPKTVRYYFIRLCLSITAVVSIVTIGTSFLPSASPFCANSISCIKDLSVKVENNVKGVFEGRTVAVPKISLSQDITNKAVLGASVLTGQKHIYVDLSSQTLYAYQGKTLVMKTLISSGKWHPTPDGTFTIWIKLRATRMTGGSGADFYDLPNVPYVMFFANNDVPASAGFSLHGAYWHNNFGHPMSHGCINMRIVDAQALYNWVDPPTTGFTTYATTNNPGTEVTVAGTAPGVVTN